MSRIREVGIYRAIGVKKSNIIFKFFAESLCIITMSVLVGYTIMSAIFWRLMSYGSAVYNMIYYQVWMGILVLILLYGISMAISIIPVSSLMNKKPAQILTQYDI